MDRVYGLADSVAVWLGDGDQHSYKAMDLISKWASTCTPDPSSDFRQVCLTLARLLHRSWFRRIWTIQELILAKQAIVVCGSFQMSWVSFREGIAQAVSIIDRDRPGFFKRMFPGFTLLDALKIPILAFPYRTFGLPLSEVLRLVRVRECSDPKDRVYALYGIFLQQDLRLPAPDYSKSARQIFIEAAWSAIIRDNSLELLSQLSCRSIADDLPSWVPDLTQHPWFPVDETVTVPNAETRLMKASFTFSDNMEKLTTQGLTLDEVGLETEWAAEPNGSYTLLSSFPGAFVTRKGHLGFRALLQDEDPTRTPYSGDLIVMLPGVSKLIIIRVVGNGQYSIICSAQIPGLIANKPFSEAGDGIKGFTFV
jgi:hypothetical protein